MKRRLEPQTPSSAKAGGKRKTAAEKAIGGMLADRLHLVVRAAGVGLFDWDLATDRCYYSPEWKRQIGYADEEISDDIEEWRSRVHPEDMPWIARDIECFLEAPVPDYQAEFRFRHK